MYPTKKTFQAPLSAIIAKLTAEPPVVIGLDARLLPSKKDFFDYFWSDLASPNRIYALADQRWCNRMERFSKILGTAIAEGLRTPDQKGGARVFLDRLLGPGRDVAVAKQAINILLLKNSDDKRIRAGVTRQASPAERACDFLVQQAKKIISDETLLQQVWSVTGDGSNSLETQAEQMSTLFVGNNDFFETVQNIEYLRSLKSSFQAERIDRDYLRTMRTGLLNAISLSTDQHISDALNSRSAAVPGSYRRFNIFGLSDWKKSFSNRCAKRDIISSLSSLAFGESRVRQKFIAQLLVIEEELPRLDQKRFLIELYQSFKEDRRQEVTGQNDGALVLALDSLLVAILDQILLTTIEESRPSYDANRHGARIFFDHFRTTGPRPSQVIRSGLSTALILRTPLRVGVSGPSSFSAR